VRESVTQQAVWEGECDTAGSVGGRV
jgi:hypothetical protein